MQAGRVAPKCQTNALSKPPMKLQKNNKRVCLGCYFEGNLLRRVRIASVKLLYLNLSVRKHHRAYLEVRYCNETQRRVQLSHHEHLHAMMVRAFVDIRFHPDQHERLISIHWRRNKHAYANLTSNDGAISSNLSVHVAIRECEGFIDDRLRVAQTWRRACLVFFSRDWISGTHMCLGIS